MQLQSDVSQPLSSHEHMNRAVAYHLISCPVWQWVEVVEVELGDFGLEMFCRENAVKWQSPSNQVKLTFDMCGTHRNVVTINGH